jgi:hypothetical protein
MNAQVNIVTIGTAEPVRSTQFYEGLGFLTPEGGEGRFGIGPVALVVRDWDALAGDAGVSPASEGFRGMTLSATFDTAAHVDVVVAAAQRMGGTVVKPARSALWGGYSSYVTDPDGHLWKIASTSKPRRGSQQEEPPTVLKPVSTAVTLGVADVKRTRQFYQEGLGCHVDKSFGGKFVSFGLGDTSWTLGLYTRAALAKDAGVAVGGSGFAGVTLETLVDGPHQVEDAVARVGQAGGHALSSPRNDQTSGYGGYVQDLDGNVWKVTAPARPTASVDATNASGDGGACD